MAFTFANRGLYYLLNMARVPAETRLLTIPAETRTATVPAESRTLIGACP